MALYEAHGGVGDGLGQNGKYMSRDPMAGIDERSPRRSYRLSRQRSCFYLFRSLKCFVPGSVRRGRMLSVMIRPRSRAMKLAMYEVIHLREHICIVHISLFQQSL
jgi:hypothetical protein